LNINIITAIALPSSASYQIGNVQEVNASFIQLTRHSSLLRHHQHHHKHHRNNSRIKRSIVSPLKVSSSSISPIHTMNTLCCCNINTTKEQNQENPQQKEKEEVIYFKSPFLHDFLKPSSNNSNENESENDSDSDSDDNIKKKIEYVNALVILNSPIVLERSNIISSTRACSQTETDIQINPIFDKLWNISSFHICADGGANRLYDATVASTTSATSTASKNKYIPNVIKGDLDSIKSHVKEYYQSYNRGDGDDGDDSDGCQIIKDPNQDYNDLDKALQSVHAWWSDQQQAQQTQKINQTRNEQEQEQPNLNTKKIVQVYIYGAFGGRFDQEMASIHALYKWSTIFDYRIFLYNHETCSWLLKPMSSSPSSKSSSSTMVRNEIQLPFYGDYDFENHNQHVQPNQVQEQVQVQYQVGEGPTCGLIPIGCKARNVITQGLKWNLDGSIPLEFGGLVSSSNRMMDDTVVVYTSDPLVFTAEIIKC